MKQLKFLKPKKSAGKKEARQFKQLRSILRYLSKEEKAQSLPNIADHVNISVPTVTKLVKELEEKELVIMDSKKETDNGRRPAVYTLNKTNFYAVGAEVLSKWIHVSVVRVDLEKVHENLNREFFLENTKECLDQIIKFISDAVQESTIDPARILGVGIALTGSVNGHTGKSADYFNDFDLPLSEYMEKELGLPVTIDNDTRVIGISEQVLGAAKGVDNALIVKVSRNLGLSIILDRNIIFGAKGFSGNLGHVQFGQKGRLCKCGKKGCLRTEVSGDALLEDLRIALNTGETSIYFNKQEIANYKYHDILDAVLKGDALAIKLLSEQGEKLGQALGNLINLLNPNMIVIGGEYVMVKDFFLDAIKTGMRKTGLVSSLKDCKVEASKLGRYFSSKGAACMVLKNNELINY
ncbi:MAG: transcriptional regulator of PTS gene [Saprospiraceae bacterium]|jgi:transcriptional regulator of PTS gene